MDLCRHGVEHPNARLHGEENPQAQSRIGSDGAVTIDQLADATRRDINVSTELARIDAHVLQKVIKQNFARMNFVK